MLDTAASLDTDQLIELLNMIRRDKGMPSAIRLLNVEKLLIAAGIIQRCEIDRLISVTKAAQLRGVTRQTIWKMLKSGTLTRYEVAGHAVIDRDELLGLPPRGQLRLTTLTFKHMRDNRKS